MSHFTYLTRRDGGMLYLQCRITMFSGRKRLLRFSLGVRDHHAAKPILYDCLRWILPMQTVLDVRNLFTEIDAQGRSIILEGPSIQFDKIRLRYHFLKTAWIQLADWMTSNPSPVSGRDLYERCAEIRLVLSFIWNMVKEDCVNLDVPSFDPPWPDIAPSALGFFAHPLMSDPTCTALCVDKSNGRVREVAYPGNYDPQIFINLPAAEARLRRNEAMFCDLYVDPNGRPVPARPLSKLDGDHASYWNAQFNDAQNTWFEDLPCESSDTLPPLEAVRGPASQVTAAQTPLVMTSPVSPVSPARPPVSVNIEASSNPHDQPSPASSMTLSEAIAEYLQDRRIAQGDGRAEEDAGLVLKFMLDFLGDVPVSGLTEKPLRAFERALAQTPDRKGIPAPHNQSLYGRYKYGQDKGLAGLKPMSEKRITNVWHRSLHKWFAYLKKKSIATIDFRFDLVAASALRSKQRDAWQDDELLKLFSRSLFTGCASKERYWTEGSYLVQNELYWAYILIFFSGMRNSEIGQLLAADIVPHGENGWVFDLTAIGAGRRLKSDAAHRLVPVPQLVIDLGLLDRKKDIEAAGGKALFPEWKTYTHTSGRVMHGHHFSKSWQYVKKVFKFDRAELTLYGGRHIRAGWYDELNLPDRVRARVLGHTNKSVAARYGANKLTPGEAKLTAQTLPIQEKIAEILLEAKIKVEKKTLKALRTW